MKVAIHAGVVVQLPPAYLVPGVAPDFLAPAAEVTSKAGRATKALLARKAGWVDMFA